MNPTLETLFSPEQKEQLSGLIPLRHACRDFSAPLSLPDRSALAYAAQRVTMPCARLQLASVPESIFTGSLLNSGRVSGCTTLAAVLSETRAEWGRVNAGMTGEAFCLEAQALGYGTCWIADTYQKSMLRSVLREGETVLAVLTLGFPSSAPLIGGHRRKAMERICRGEEACWTEEYLLAAEAVRRAPSAKNLQPWTLTAAPGWLQISVPTWAQLELGIAMCHAELCLTAPHHWQLAFSGSEVQARAVAHG